MHDLIVVGAGPAGIQAAYFLKKTQLSFKVLERSEGPGSFFEKFPRHGKLISINKRFTGKDDPEFNLRHDWNSLISEDGPRFTAYDERLFPSADSLVKYLNDFVTEQNIDISYQSEVKEISRQGDIFHTELTDGQVYQSRAVIIATGYTRPNIPDAIGIEHAQEYADISVDKNDFTNQRVLIIGKGNSAFETADNLVDTAAVIHLASPESIRMAWSTHYVGNLRAVNNNILDMYQLKSQHAAIDADVERIEKVENGYEVVFKYKHAQGEVEALHYDVILSCAGFKMSTDIFADNCMPTTTLKGKFPKLTPAFESENIPGLYFAGTLTHSLDFRKATSGFIHGFRYNVRALVQILNNRLNQEKIKSLSLERSNDSLTRFLIDRVNIVSSIWQQPGFLSEFFKFNDADIEHYEAMPLDYGVSDYFKDDDILALTFEYGHDLEGDVFAQHRIARDNLDEAARSQFLHPVLRHYCAGELQSEFHVIEDLEANWTIGEHYSHIREFMDATLTDLKFKIA